MMGKFSRDKGSRYERKIAGELNSFFGWNLVRNLEQSRRDFHGDLIGEKSSEGPENFVIELKNRVSWSWDNIIGWNPKPEGPANWVELQLSRNWNTGRDVWLIFRSTLIDMSLIYVSEHDPLNLLNPEQMKDFHGFSSGRLLLSTLKSAKDHIKWTLSNLHKK